MVPQIKFLQDRWIRMFLFSQSIQAYFSCATISNCTPKHCSHCPADCKQFEKRCLVHHCLISTWFSTYGTLYTLDNLDWISPLSNNCALSLEFSVDLSPYIQYLLNIFHLDVSQTPQSFKACAPYINKWHHHNWCH